MPYEEDKLVPHEEITHKKDTKKHTRWTDLYRDGRRIDRIIRYIETKMKKATEDDKIIKYANSIGFLTSKKIEIVDLVLGVEDIIRRQNELKKREERHGIQPKSMYDV